MLEMDDLPPTDLQILREAVAQVDQAQAYSLEYELQKANLAKLDADGGLWERAKVNLETSVSLVGNSAQAEEWRVLLADYAVTEISEIVLIDDDGHQLRLISPVRGFLSQAEQSEVYARVMGGQLPASKESGQRST